MSDVLTRGQLDTMGCSTPGCGCKDEPLTFHAACHPRHPTWAEYDKGILVITCAVCGRTAARVAVAP